MVGSAAPLSVRISLTSQCQLRCSYCMPACGPGRTDPPLSVEEIVSFAAEVGGAFGLTKTHLTGGEPLLRGDILALVEGLGGLFPGDLALTTNGQRLAGLAGPLRQAGLARVNVSLDSLNPDRYRAVTRGGRLSATLDGIIEARACGLPVKTNTVVIRGVNDGEVADIARWGLRLGCCVRFLELMPIGPAREDRDSAYVSSNEVHDGLSVAFDLQPLASPPGGTTQSFLARDRRGLRGVIGLISSRSQPFCQGCRRLRLTSGGQLIGCLGLGRGPSIRSLLPVRSPEQQQALFEAVTAALGMKRSTDQFATEHLMAYVGG